MCVQSPLKRLIQLNTVVFLPKEPYLGTCKHYSVFKVLLIYSTTGGKKWKCKG